MKKISQSPQNLQKGFTLIELVIVIVILGILAATAAPKFIDLTGDAKTSTMKAVRGAVESATTMVHAKALVLGKTSESAVAKVKINDVDTNLIAGWPTNEITVWSSIANISGDSFLTKASGTAGSGSASIIWYPKQDPDITFSEAETAKCFVKYVESNKKSIRPVITIDTDNC